MPIHLGMKYFLYFETSGCIGNATCHLLRGFSWKNLKKSTVWNLLSQSYLRISSDSSKVPKVTVFLIAKFEAVTLLACYKLVQCKTKFVIIGKTFDQSIDIYVSNTNYGERRDKKSKIERFCKNTFKKKYNRQNSDDKPFIGALRYLFQSKQINIYLGTLTALMYPVFLIDIDKNTLHRFNNLEVCLLRDKPGLKTPVFTKLLPGQRWNNSVSTLRPVEFIEILHDEQYRKISLTRVDIYSNKYWKKWEEVVLINKEKHQTSCMNNTCMILSDEDIRLGIVGEDKSNISLQINTYYTGRSVCGGLSHVQVNLPWSMQICKFTRHHKTPYFVIKPLKSMILNIWFTDLQVSDEWLKFCQCNIERSTIAIYGNEELYLHTFLFGIPIKMTSNYFKIIFRYLCIECHASMKWFAKSVWPTGKYTYTFSYRIKLIYHKNLKTVNEFTNTGKHVAD